MSTTMRAFFVHSVDICIAGFMYRLRRTEFVVGENEDKSGIE